MLFSLAAMLACQQEADTAAPEATWHGGVQAVMAEHCSGCHYDGDGSPGTPFVFDNYESAALYAAAAASATTERRMPPWGAQPTDECQPQWGWLDDLSLSEDEIALLQDWADAGAPEGVDDGTPIPGFIEGTSLDRVDLSMTIGQAWSTAPSDSDSLRCFELDPQITDETSWFSGIEITPGNTAVNHHAALFVVDENEDGTHSLDDYQDSYGAGASWECFGGASCSPSEDADCPGSISSQVVQIWTPGSGAVKTPPQSAIQLKAGARFVLQIHYHPSPMGTEVDDSTQLELQRYDGVPLYQASTGVVGLSQEGQRFDDGALVIPAGEEDWTNTATTALPSAAIWSVLPHMHAVGTEIRVEINRQSGEDECLAEVPAWDYAWQRIYRMASLYETDTLSLEDGPIVQSGDSATVTCTFNNSPSNEQLVETYRNEGDVDEDGEVLIEDVPIGEGTTEEMCLAIIGLLQPIE